MTQQESCVCLDSDSEGLTVFEETMIVLLVATQMVQRKVLFIIVPNLKRTCLHPHGALSTLKFRKVHAETHGLCSCPR